MSADTGPHDPHGIVPEAFKREVFDPSKHDGFRDALAYAAACAQTDGDDYDKPRCPACLGTNITEKAASEGLAPGNRKEPDHRCHTCGEHFDQPRESRITEFKRRLETMPERRRRRKARLAVPDPEHCEDNDLEEFCE